MLRSFAVLPRFAFGRAAGRNDPYRNSVRRTLNICMNRHNEPAVSSFAECNPARLMVAIVLVEARHGQGIKEYLHGDMEGNAVLIHIGRSLRRVPINMVSGCSHRRASAYPP
jgi:hypothetical protein